MASKIYEIYSGRFDIPESLYTSFSASSDEKAIALLEESKALESNSWNTMRLVEVVTKRVERHIKMLK